MARAVALPLPKDTKQSTIWLGALLAMFILYLAMNNRLAVYWSLLTGGTGATSGATSSSSTGAATAPQSGSGSTGGTITITPLTGQTPPATTGGNAP